MQQETQKFLRPVTDVGVLTTGQIYLVDLSAFQREFGNNFNTLNVINKADEEISVTLDGKKVQYIPSLTGVMAFDWRDGLIYSTLAITNEGATSTSANEIRISVGRTGSNDIGGSK